MQPVGRYWPCYGDPSTSSRQVAGSFFQGGSAVAVIGMRGADRGRSLNDERTMAPASWSRRRDRRRGWPSTTTPGRSSRTWRCSKRFYQEVLGFSPWYEITPPDEATAKLCCLEPPLGVTASYLTLDGFVLELMHYSAPGATVPYVPRGDERAWSHPLVHFGGRCAGDCDESGRVWRRDCRGERRRRRPLHPRSRRPAARAAAGWPFGTACRPNRKAAGMEDA